MYIVYVFFRTVRMWIADPVDPKINLIKVNLEWYIQQIST